MGGSSSKNLGKTRAPPLTRLLVLVALLLPVVCPASEVLVVQSGRLRAYDDAYESFQRSLASPPSGPKQVRSDVVTPLLLPENTTDPELARSIRSRKPDLIVAIGSRALSALRNVSHIPLVYLLSPDAPELSAGRGNVTGVSLDIPAGASLKGLLSVAPSVRRVGVVHDPRRTGALLGEATRVAARLGLSLVVREARSASGVAAALESMGDQVDALWMLPDLTVTGPESVEAMLLFSLERGVPVLTFAEKYLDLGATVAVTFDPGGLGEQAAAIAKRILEGASPGQIPASAPERVLVRVNRAVAAKLGLPAAPAR